MENLQLKLINLWQQKGRMVKYGKPVGSAGFCPQAKLTMVSMCWLVGNSIILKSRLRETPTLSTNADSRTGKTLVLWTS